MGKIKFYGGVHPLSASDAGKTTGGIPVSPFRPARVRILMDMHLGTPSRPCVKAGDRVLTGQVIGEPVGPLGVRVHASVSGRVLAVAEAQDCDSAYVEIENDRADEWVELHPRGAIDDCAPSEILLAVSDAGICGMGGAGFPTHAKLRIPEGKRCDLVLLNGAECETHMTSDHRLMAETPKRVVDGLRAALRATGAQRGVIAIEDNKPDAIEAVTEAAREFKNISVKPLPVRYPQGGERQLILSVTGKEVPSGGLPIDIGIVVLNVATAAAISDAVTLGKPLIERIVTVTGRVSRPGNLLVPIGTPVGELMAFAGAQDGKVVFGGAMMGPCSRDAQTPIEKGMDGVVVLDDTQLPAATPCIRCGRCSQVCPARLVPYEMEAYILADRLDAAEGIGVMDCILCGCCSYICPAHRRLAPAFGEARIRISVERRNS
jgi:electron transport complex protein RnfC